LALGPAPGFSPEDPFLHAWLEAATPGELRRHHKMDRELAEMAIFSGNEIPKSRRSQGFQHLVWSDEPFGGAMKKKLGDSSPLGAPNFNDQHPKLLVLFAKKTKATSTNHAFCSVW